MTALIFISPGCEPCHNLLRDLATRGADRVILHPATTYVLSSLGDPEESRRELQAASMPPDVPLYLAEFADLRMLWGITQTPTIVILNADMTFVRHQVGFAPPAMPLSRMKAEV